MPACRGKNERGAAASTAALSRSVECASLQSSARFAPAGPQGGPPHHCVGRSMATLPHQPAFAELASRVCLGLRPARKGWGGGPSSDAASNKVTSTPRASASRSSTSIVGFATPRSMPLRYGAATRASTARVSCDSPRSARRRRRFRARRTRPSMDLRHAGCAL